MKPDRRAWITYDFPLRPDFLAQLVLPKDLTTEEAKKLAAFLATLVQPSAGRAS